MDTDAPSPTLPDVFKVLREVSPDTSKEELKSTPEVTVKEEPSPTLPVALSPARLVRPVTFKPFNAPNPVMEAPTPTLPVVVRVFLNKDSPLTVKVFKSVLPSTCSEEEKVPADVTESDCPTPTLPVVTSDPPTPKLPEKLPVPLTWKLKTGVEVPTPTLPLSKTVSPKPVAFVP